MKSRLTVAGAILALSLTFLKAGNADPVEFSMTSTNGVAEKLLTEAIVGRDRIGLLPSALLQYSSATAATTTVQIASGTITNTVDLITPTAATTDSAYSPTVFLYLKAADILRFTCSDTSIVTRVRGWVD